MAHALRDDGHVDTAGEHQRRRPVAKLVQPDLAKAGGLDEPAVQLGDLPRGQVGAVLAGEHAVVVGVAAPPLRPLGVLGEPVGQQRAYGDS